MGFPVTAAVPITSVAASANADVLAFFVVGLLGGAHCLGMCGPLVTMYADQASNDAATKSGRRGRSGSSVRQQALFNVGRALSYTTLGVAFGAVGALLVDVGVVLAVGSLVRGVAGVVAGLAIVAAGVGYIAGGQSRIAGASIPLLGGAFTRVVGVLRAQVEGWATGPGILGLGALHGLLPCPLLYPAFLYALATGSPLRGGLALAALGLGTIPSLFVYGTAMDSMSQSTRRRLHHALGVAFVLAGTIPLTSGLGALGYPVPHVPLPMPAPPG